MPMGLATTLTDSELRDLLAFLKDATQPGHAPSMTARRGNQMGGMMGMMGGGPVPNLKKLDPDGVYVRRYVPELEDVPGSDIAEPGLLAPSYPRPLVDHGAAVAAFRTRRGLG